jgi:hypothetical protein
MFSDAVDDGSVNFGSGTFAVVSIEDNDMRIRHTSRKNVGAK